ncbi:MAG: GPW/gp25 family protein [Minicystis sp.]
MTDQPREARRRPPLLARLDKGDESELDAIVRNLDATLNTKAGYGAMNSVFGLADQQGYLSSRDALEELVAGMLEQVVRFEPRVELPVLRLVGRDGVLWARFELSGKVNGRRTRIGIRFHTILRTLQVHHI